MVAAPHRVIEHVPVLLVGLLAEVGKLPSVAAPATSTLGYRPPAVADAAAFQWLIEWEGHQLDASGFRRAAGVAGYRDVYDWHTASDVCEIAYIAGSRRACVDLIRKIAADAQVRTRRLIGAIDLDNHAMSALIDSMGYRVTRVIFEAKE